MRNVFTRLSYLSLAGGVALVVFLLVLWLPNVRLIFLFFLDSSVPLSFATHLTVDLLASSVANTPSFSLWYTALAALLIGINAALLVFYIRFYRKSPSLRHVVSGIVGSFLALTGFACVSCGPIFFAALFTAASGASFLAAIPYLGSWIGILGIGLLITSTVLLARAINTPPVCPI